MAVPERGQGIPYKLGALWIDYPLDRRGPRSIIAMASMIGIFPSEHVARIALGLATLSLLPSLALGGPPPYGEGQVTSQKVAYCEALVSRYGHLSQRYNFDYYGQGVQAPLRGAWDMETRTPGWFSDELYIVFKQTTVEPVEDFEHVAYCHWSEDAPWFEFNIRRFDKRTITVCDVGSMIDPCS